MSEHLTIDKIVAAMTTLLDESTRPIKDTLDQHTATLTAHSTALDTLLKNTANWSDEMTIMRERMQRYEQALKLIGQQLNLDLGQYL